MENLYVGSSSCSLFTHKAILGVLENLFKHVDAFQIKLEFGSVGVCREVKTQVHGEEPLGAMERTNNKLNPNMASMPGFKQRATLVGGECSYHCTTLAPTLARLNVL